LRTEKFLRERGARANPNKARKILKRAGKEPPRGGKPLTECKARLCELVRRSRCPRLLYAQHVEGAGKELFHEISRCDLEGIVAKRKVGMYREDRPDWLKIKNRTYSQAEGRHEMLTRARKKN